MAIAKPAIHKLAQPAAGASFWPPFFLWMLARLDTYGRWETFLSLQEKLGFLNNAWFTPVAILLGFGFLHHWYQSQIDSANDGPMIYEASDKPYVLKARARTPWLTISIVASAIPLSVLYLFLWLWTYDPKLPQGHLPVSPPVYTTAEIAAQFVESRSGTASQSQVTITQTSAPNSANIVGSGNQVTINPALPPRRIPPERRAEIVRYLSTRPAKVELSAVANDPEAYRFARDWYEVLKEAGWSIEGDAINVFLSGGEPRFGVWIKIQGEPVGYNEWFQVPMDSPAGHLGRVLQALKVSLNGQRFPGMESDKIALEVHFRPQND